MNSSDTPRTPEERRKVAAAITEAMCRIEKSLRGIADIKRQDLEQAAQCARKGLAPLGDADEKVQKARKVVDALIDSCKDYDASLSGGGTDWGTRAARRMLLNTLRVDKALREL